MLKKATSLVLMVLILSTGLLLGQKKCLYLSTSAVTPPSESSVITDKLENEWGFEVSYKNIGDYGTIIVKPEDHDFIIIDELISSSDMEAVGQEWPKPILCFEGWGTDYFNFTEDELDSKNIGTQPISIENPDHPVAGGLSGEVDMTTTAGDETLIQFKIDAEGVEGIGKATDAGNWQLAAVEEGAQVIGRTAPNRLVVMGLHANGYEGLTEDAFTIMKASIDWITGEGSAIDDGKTNPTKYKLAQNYPNPFNPTTTINYALKESGKTTINVYNVNGELVENLVNGYRNAGQEYKVRFNASNKPAGVYFYRIEAGNFTKTRKMVLMK